MRLRAILFLASMPLWAQWTKVPPDPIPRTADGKPNLSAPAPRLPNGKPDLSGVWSPNANKYLRDIAVDLKPGEVPFQPWAKALYEQRIDGSHSKEDPDANCLPQGVPKIDAAPAPWKIVQTPRFIVIAYEAFNLWRQIFLDGREVAADVNPSWMGYSVGKWDGARLVVGVLLFEQRRQPAHLEQRGFGVWLLHDYAGDRPAWRRSGHRSPQCPGRLESGSGRHGH